ncbi:MAG: pteridine reductase [Chromatiales bacterium]|nr:pteridine reductase [Chromatiales bacterium]
MKQQKVVLITAAAKRIGAQIARTLHQADMKVLLHYHKSSAAAQKLSAQLNELRPDSVQTLTADLSDLQAIKVLAQNAQARWGYVDALVNNAAAFYPTELNSVDAVHWEQHINLNMRAPLFLSCELAPILARQQGCIVNIGDIHAIRPLKGHTVYSASKAGLAMITQSLAKELAPEVRCNAVYPGAILWPENDYDDDKRQEILNRTLLKRAGHPMDIASAVLFLVRNADYITGQTLIVDGGRTLHS